MKVCIAEKPSVAKEIAAILGASSRKDGYFEGNGYQVTWTFGHLCTLKEPNDYTEQWKWWNLDALPMLPSTFGIKVIDDQGVQKQFNTIKRLVGACDEVINCGDAGQEGEVIQRWVLAKAQCKVPLKRLWISSLTEEAIKEGFKNLKEGSDFDNLYAAGSSRAIGDWLLGMNATRLYTLKYGKDKQVLSVGRVQTPTLAMIVNRQKEIMDFKSSTYWELKTMYRDVLFSSTKGKIGVKENGDAMMAEIKEADFTVKSYEQKEGKEAPLRLYDLTSLQVDCNKKYGTSADQTLKNIQKLYEGKAVTYPRVDTTYLPNDVYPKIAGILSKLSYYSQYTEPLLKEKIRKSSKVFNDKKVTDHHAIIPTGQAPSGVTPEQQQVYQLITKRFISVFYPDCIVSNTTVIGEVKEVEFKATGKQVLKPGWRVVYGVSEDADPNEEDIMPSFEKGESGSHEPELQEKQTQAPKYFTEATLLRGMETAGKHVDDEELREIMKENGIGRPSTRANIIETLYRRRYIAKEKKRLVATVMGMELIDTIQNELLKSAELTGQWEKKLRDIERGEYDVTEFKKEMFQMVTDIVYEVKYDKSARQITMVTEEDLAKPKPKAPREKKEKKLVVATCPKCQKGTMLKGKAVWGCSEFKGGCDFRIPFKLLNKKFSEKQMEQITKKKMTSKLKGVVMSEGGEKFEGKFILTEEFNFRFIKD